MIYSFDIFDTCISRKYYQPHNLYLELAQKVLKLDQLLVSDKKIDFLAKKRLDAEIIARKTSTKDDILISDIYKELEKFKSIAVDLNIMKSLELSLELENTVPVPRMLKFYKKLKSNNQRIIFVSDMYLPKYIIVKMLNKCGYQVQADELYISGELGLSKRKGSLFDYILNQEKINPEDIIHYGDNLLSDIKNAKKYGINVSFVSDIHTTNRYEQELMHKGKIWNRLSHKLQKNLRIYKFFYREPLSSLSIKKQLSLSRTSAVAKLLRLKYDIGTRNKHIDIISFNVAAPLMTSFVFWVLNNAKSKGITRLYFIARNGQIFYKIAKLISKSLNYNIDCRYLYGSRLAWYPAMFTKVDNRFIDIILKRYAHRTIYQILSDFRFTEQEISELIKSMGVSLDYINTTSNATEVCKFFTTIKNSEFNLFFEKKFLECKMNIADYLRSNNFFDDLNIGIVDIGWRLSTHNALYDVMKVYSSRGFTGFYFGINREHEKVSAKTPFFSYITNVNNKKNNWLFKLGSVMILEDVFSAADHGSTIGYLNEKGGSTPLLNESYAYDYSNNIRIIQAKILEFVELIIHDENDLEIIRDEALTVFELFYKYPKASEVLVISQSNVFTMTSHAQEQKRVLAHTIEFKELFFIIVRVLSLNRNWEPKWVWFQGSLSISNYIISVFGKILSFFESMLLKRIK